MGGFTAILDYGVGNLMSVKNALNYLGIENRVTSDAADMEQASAVILPGVGAYYDAMQELKIRCLDCAIRDQAKKKPLLGICLGMQLLFESSSEVRLCEGLGLIEGDIALIQTDNKLPHIGWNSLDIKNPCELTKGLTGGEYVYFVHSYSARVRNNADLCATVDYGTPVCAIVSRGNVFGCQFHPEKSGETGLHILKNFGELSK
jgi:glutamine amidotransferase